MDITHTFHFPFGEMTIAPLDFAAITDLSFFGEVVPFSDEACNSVVARNAWLKDLFGVVDSVKCGCCTML